MYKYISSNQNETLKTVKKIRDDGRKRDELGLFFAEGITLINEVENELIDSIYIDEDRFEDILDKLNKDIKNLNDEKIYKIKSSVFENIADTKNSQGICALVKIKNNNFDEFLKGCDHDNTRVLILENISDPGNVGTILRTSLAFGISGVMLDEGCADAYSPKVVRSSMGAIFKQNIYISKNLQDDIASIRKRGTKVYATSPSKENSIDCESQDFSKISKLALVFGNEAHGLSDETIKNSDALLRLDISPEIESLNVAVCASICMFITRCKKES